jgi:hypothetical protein
LHGIRSENIKKSLILRDKSQFWLYLAIKKYRKNSVFFCLHHTCVFVQNDM